MPAIPDLWPLCLHHLEAEFPAEDVRTWLKPLQPDQRGDALVLYAPNGFVRDEV
ncbi:MAG TPA: DnaA N-terminal domain-containing protein, partial [Thermomonas sp.]|nr:DnaA N-terminal domain-containing protein [Thermomonas sp.]